MFAGVRLVVPAIVAVSVAASVTQEAYTWDNVFIGGGGGISYSCPLYLLYAVLIWAVEGFIPGIVFNPTQKGLTYARYVSRSMFRYSIQVTNYSIWQCRYWLAFTLCTVKSHRKLTAFIAQVAPIVLTRMTRGHLCLTGRTTLLGTTGESVSWT